MLNALKEFLTNEIKPTDNTYKDSPVILYGRAGNRPGLEGINIYLFENTVFTQVYTPLNERKEKDLKSLLIKTFSPGIPNLRLSIVDRSAITPRMIFLSDEITEDIIYSEYYRGSAEEKEGKNQFLNYALDLKRPSHPGLFFDIVPTRKWVLDHSRNKKVLNLFAFTCPFSVCAAAGGASLVINMDNNSNVLTRGRKNHTLNNLDLSKISFEKKDVMKSFGFINKKGPFDIIICDPPSLQKGSFNAPKDYPKMVRRLKEALAPEGILILCLNDPFLGFDFLEEIIREEGLIETERIAPAEAFIPADRERGLKVICVKNNQS